MISLYRPGSSPLHRMPAGPKLLAFAVLAVAVSILSTSLIGLAVSVVAAVAAYLLAGLGPLDALRQALVIRWVLLTMLVTQLLFLPPLVAVANTGRVVVVVVLAGLITLTTRIPSLLDSVEQGLRPFRRVGVNPGAVALTLALVLTAIPVIARFAHDIRDAQRARGVRVSPHHAVVPLLVMTLKHSDDLAEALAARGAE